MAILKLNKAVMIDGKSILEIDYDLDGLTGADIQLAVKELQLGGVMIAFNETDSNYHAALFAKAADITYADMGRFGAKDYNKAANLVRDFFLLDTVESLQSETSAE